MKKLLYSGFVALMMFFAIGFANAEDTKPAVRVLWTGVEDAMLEWNMEESAPTFTVTVSGDDDGSLVWGTGEGNVALEIKLVFDDSYGGEGEDVTQVFTSITGTLELDVEDLVAGEYDVKYRLVKGDDQNTKFDEATVSGNLLYLTVKDANAASYMIQTFNGLTNEPLSTETENPAALYYPFATMMVYSSDWMPMGGEFYYSFGTEGVEAVEPTREAFEATDNNDKVKKAFVMSQQGQTFFQIYTDDATATSVKIKGYLTPAENMGGDFEPELKSVRADGESEPIVTETYSYTLSFLESATVNAVFTPAAASEIESGASVKLSVDNIKIAGKDTVGQTDIYYSLNGKTPLYNYGSVDKTSGIFEYDDEDGIVINVDADGEVTVTAIVYFMDAEYMCHTSQTITATYTVKAAEPKFTLNPANGATVNVGDEITITSTTVGDDEIAYKWFATKAEAEAAAYSYTEWSNYDDAGKPVVAAGLPVLAVTQGFVSETAGSRMFAEYTINAATGVTITFNPADGAEVEVGDTIKLTASENVTIVYMMFPSKELAEFNEWKWQEDPNSDEYVGFVYGRDGYPVITETMKAVKAGYIKSQSSDPETTFFHAGYTIKAGGETPDPADVDAPAIDKAAGAYVTGTVITVAKGTADSIFVATGKTEAEATAFVKATADVTVTLTADTVIRAFAMKAGEYSDTVMRAYTIKTDDDPTVIDTIMFTFKPAPGEVEDSTKVTIEFSRELGEEEVVFFAMFADRTAADTCSEEDMLNMIKAYGEPEDEEDETTGYPVITKAAPVLKVGYIKGEDEEGNYLYAWTIAEYTIKSVANEANELAGVSIYPNPTDGEFSVVAPANAQVEIFTAAGVMVKRMVVAEGNAYVRLDNSGIYFVRVRANGQAAIRKVVVR